jgi:hypothetical protein
MAVATVLAGEAPVLAAAPALTLGFSAFDTTVRGDLRDQPLALAHLKATRATQIRLMWTWAGVEKVQPPTDQAGRDPSYSGYDFGRIDAIVRAVTAAGVEPLMEFSQSPPWWEGPDRPPVSEAVRSGSWRPDPAAFGRFMTAVARRYSGTYPDPLNPAQMLPRVRQWQIWNEPNLFVELNPQWSGTGAGATPVSPGLYRQLLAAAYDAVKSVSSTNLVVTAGTAPYGEPGPCEPVQCPTGGPRMQPARFVRELLCVTAKLKARNCHHTPAKFDVLAHHPYPIGPPGRTARNPDDVVVPDFAKLTKPLAVALKAGNVVPQTTSKPVWATEMSWDSNPPDPGGIPAGQQAQYAAGAMYVLWRQGVKAMYWWNLRDDPPEDGSYATSLQSGVYYRGATIAEDMPKPALTAFRFPFVAYRAYSNFQGHGAAKLWGMAPAPGRVTIQRRAGTSWTTVTTTKPHADHIFQLRISADRGLRLRAVQAGEASIDAKVF